MATEKQVEANQKNALQSTGPNTETGKATVSKNAVKHGIFSKDLIIADGDGRENVEDFNELHQNLIESLRPDGQMQHILVEKIAVDTWRLKRVLRYETGCIRQFLNTAILVYHNNAFSNEELEMEIKLLKEKVENNQKYVECFRSGAVSFASPYWENGDIKINLEKELNAFYKAKELDIPDDINLLRMAGHLDFENLYRIIKQNHYSDDDIRKFIIENAERENMKHQKEMRTLEKRKQGNAHAGEMLAQVQCLPQDENIDKVLKYEKMFQKSIIQSLTILNQLQKNS